METLSVNNYHGAILLEEYLPKMLEKLESWAGLLPELGVAIVVLIVGSFISRSISRKEDLFNRVAPNLLLAGLFRQTLGGALMVGAIVLALDIVGAGSLLGAVLGTAGVVGLGISFAFKDIVENYIAGVLLSIKQPFRQGDHVVIGDAEGLVQRMTTRITMVKSFDGNNISIPNATVFKSQIVNYTKNPERRFKFMIGIDAEADPDIARQIGLKAMAFVDGVLQDPRPLALIDSVGDSSIAIQFLGWMNQQTHDFGLVRSAAVRLVKMEIEASGIAIPEPIFTIKMVQPQVALEGGAQQVRKVKPSDSKGLDDTKLSTQPLIPTQEREEDGAARHLREEGSGGGGLLGGSNTE